jgi:hypothetical protein
MQESFALYANAKPAPKEQDLPLVERLIEERKARAAKLTSMIEDAKASLAVMEAERAAHIQWIWEHTKLLVPVR